MIYAVAGGHGDDSNGAKCLIRIGAVSFLNAKPLIAGIDAVAGLRLSLAVPSALESQLRDGRADAALLPIIDVIRSSGRLRVLSDAAIACDGETMTVRVFSQVPPDRIRRLAADTHSHTSVALARVLWHELYDRTIEITPFDACHVKAREFESVLLIGDKVVDPNRHGFAYEIDLGGAWRAHTGLPFVFAVWAAHASWVERHPADAALVTRELQASRDRGVALARQIAREQGRELGWPVELAERYLCRCLLYRLDARMIEGANLFARLASRLELAPTDAEIHWPAPQDTPAATRAE